MALNEDPNHPAHSVSDYFEILKMRHPSLFLLRDEQDKEIKDGDPTNGGAKINTISSGKAG